MKNLILMLTLLIATPLMAQDTITPLIDKKEPTVAPIEPPSASFTAPLKSSQDVIDLRREVFANRERINNHETRLQALEAQVASLLSNKGRLSAVQNTPTLASGFSNSINPDPIVAVNGVPVSGSGYTSPVVSSAPVQYNMLGRPMVSNSTGSYQCKGSRIVPSTSTSFVQSTPQYVPVQTQYVPVQTQQVMQLSTPAVRTQSRKITLQVPATEQVTRRIVSTGQPVRSPQPARRRLGSRLGRVFLGNRCYYDSNGNPVCPN